MYDDYNLDYTYATDYTYDLDEYYAQDLDLDEDYEMGKIMNRLRIVTLHNTI